MKESNDEAMNTSLELLDEQREAVFVRLASRNNESKGITIEGPTFDILILGTWY